MSIVYFLFLCKACSICKEWDSDHSVGTCCCRIQFGDLARLNSFLRATETIPLTVQPFCFRSNQDEEVDQVSVVGMEQKNLDTFFAQIQVCKNIWDEFFDHAEKDDQRQYANPLVVDIAFILIHTYDNLQML